MSLKKKDIAISLVGVILGQIIFFVCLTIVGREWGAEELGNLNLNLSLGMFIGTVIAFRYELACIQDTKEASYHALIHVLIITLAVFAFSYLIASLFEIVSAGIILIFAATYALQQASGFYLNTMRKYVLIGLIKVVANICFVVLLVMIVYFGEVYSTFKLYAEINLVVTIVLFVLIVSNSSSFKFGLGFFKDNYKFPKYTLPATALNSVLIYSLPVVVPFLFGPITAGYFAATQRFGFFPVTLVAQGVSGVFRREVISITNSGDGDLLKVYMSHLKLLLVVAFCYLLFGNLLFGVLIEVLLGDSWAQAAVLFHIMSPLYALQIVYIPLSQIFMSTGNQKVDLFIQIIIFVSTVGPLLASYCFSFGINVTLIVFTVSSSIALLVGLKFTYQIAKNTLKKPAFYEMTSR